MTEKVELVCFHEWVFLRTAKWAYNTGSYNTRYTRVDTFFCRHCLEQKEIKKENWCRDTPDWYGVE